MKDHTVDTEIQQEDNPISARSVLWWFVVLMVAITSGCLCGSLGYETGMRYADMRAMRAMADIPLGYHLEQDHTGNISIVKNVDVNDIERRLSALEKDN